MCFHMVRVLLSYIYQPFILFIVILTITLSIFLPLISKVRVFLLPTCVSNLSSFQSQTDGRHNFAKGGKGAKKESSWKEQLLPISYLIHFYQSDQITKLKRNRKKRFVLCKDQRFSRMILSPGNVPPWPPLMDAVNKNSSKYFHFYPYNENIFTHIVTILGQSEPDMFSEVCPPPCAIPTFTKSSTVSINYFPQNWR